MKIRDLKTVPRSFMGIPVRFDPDLKGHAAAAEGLWPFKLIRLGPLWLACNFAERMAVLYHEAGHCKLLHAEKRLMLSGLMLLNPRLVWRVLRLPIDISNHALLAELPESFAQVARQHELEADRYAVDKGFAHGMLQMLERFRGQAPVPTYPSAEERIARIQERLQDQRQDQEAIP